MHKLLTRLLKRYLPDNQESINFKPLLNAVSQEMYQNDEDKDLIERSLTLASNDLKAINKDLKQNLINTQEYQSQLEVLFARQQALLNVSPEAIFSFHLNGEIENLSCAACKFLGVKRKDIESNKIKINFSDFLLKINPEDEFYQNFYRTGFNQLENLKGVFQSNDGKYFEYHSQPEMIDGECIGRVWYCRDITVLRKNKDLLVKQAYYDALTGLPNRAMLMKSLASAIENAKAKNTKIGVLFVDLDDFKKINDASGHSEGDRFLIDFSRRAELSINENCLIGRLGGDEFLIIIEDIQSKEEISDIYGDFCEILKSPFRLSTGLFHMSSTTGISCFPDDAEDSEGLIRKSDMAMYQAKKRGKNNFRFFDSSIEQIALNKLEVENDLREAIENNDFVLHFQPKMSLVTNKIVGAEALIRWVKPGGQIVYPDSFIGIAEETGLIKKITQWLIKDVCQKISDWESTSLEGIPISINISALDFADDSFLDNALSVIRESGIKPELLEFELTESMLFDDIEAVKKTIRILKENKIKISIDDFGTGFSSFSYLRDMEIDYLKIDKSFVMGLHKDIKSKAIVKSIIDIGTNLGLKVIAEGVESEIEMKILADEGCHIGQGYHLSRPITERALLKFSALKAREINKIEKIEDKVRKMA